MIEYVVVWQNPMYGEIGTWTEGLGLGLTLTLVLKAGCQMSDSQIFSLISTLTIVMSPAFSQAC